MARRTKRGFKTRRPAKNGSRRAPTKPPVDLYRKPDVFLSYNHQDKRFVRKLANDLSRVGVDPWLDAWELGAGDPLRKYIGRALTYCRYVALVISPGFVKSQWCGDELEAALAREDTEGRTVIIPLLCKRTRLPAFLAGRIYLDFAKEYLPSLAKLSALVHRMGKKRLDNALMKVDLTSVYQVADLLSECGWDGVRLFDEDEWEEFQVAMADLGYEIRGSEFEFPDDFEEIAPELMHVAVVKAIYGHE
jgi:hypothetical protein